MFYCEFVSDQKVDEQICMKGLKPCSGENSFLTIFICWNGIFETHTVIDMSVSAMDQDFYFVATTHEQQSLTG